MWDSLLFFAVSAVLLVVVSSGPVKQTIIISNNANAASSAAASAGEGGDSSAASSSAASSGSTSIIKNEKQIIKCAKNERYEKCPERMCEPQLCDEVAVSSCSAVQISSQNNCKGHPACVCIANYVRNDFGVCIPKENCGNPTDPGATEDPGDGGNACATGPPDAGTTAPDTGTTAPGTGTTAPGSGTTAPGTGTTAPGTETIAPGTETTAPGTGTTAPGTGTTAPGTGTTAPVTGTTAPGNGSTAPETGTTKPDTGTTAPGTGTTATSTGTTAPETGTTKPGTGTTAPGTGTTAPETGTTAPGTGTTAPGTGTTAPGTGSTAPGTGTAAPGTGTTAPVTGSSAPGTGTTAPGTGTTSPGTVTTSPGTGTTAPGTGTTAPGSGTTAPGTGTTAPGTETTAPGTETTAPGTGTTAPGTGTTAPGTGTTAPVTGTTAPGNGSTAPETGTTKPGTGTTAPGTGTTATGTGTTAPETGTTKPGTGTTSPGTGTTAPGTGTTAPGNGTTAPGTGTTAPSTGTTAPGTGTTAPGTGTTAPGTGSTAPGTGTTAPGTGTTAPGTGTTATGTGTTAPGSGTTAPGTGSTAPGTGTTAPGTGTTAPGTGTIVPGTGTTVPGTGTTVPGSGTTGTPEATTKGPKDCKGKNEWYFQCAPACPQQTCSEYLNSTSCSLRKSKSCIEECRCLIGFYRDDDGNCLAGWECKKAAKHTTSASEQGATSTTVSATPDEICTSDALEAFVLANLEFTPKLLDGLIKLDHGNDVLVGGASILFMMAQLALYGTNATQKEILKALRFKNIDQIRCFFPKFAVQLKAVANKVDLNFEYFCKIYADDKCTLTSQFKNEIEELFTVRPENLNFKASGSAKQITSEVAQYTNNSVVNFVKPEVLSSLDSLMMADALSVKGEWLKPFNPKDTELKYFFGPTKMVKRLIMRQQGTFLYFDSYKLGAQIVKLPYKSDPDLKLALFLPRTIHGVSDLISRLKNADEVAMALNALREEEVDIHVPKFNVTVANLLKIPSENANVSLIFNNATAGLEKVALCDKPYVSEILQKVTYQIDESGVGEKAVDFPLPEQEMTTRPSYKRVHLFKADRPFIFYLFYRKLLLASGAIVR